MAAVVAVLVAEEAAHLILEDATPPRPGDVERPALTPRVRCVVAGP
ncbi:hypothetical protein ACQSSU_08635 [Micromonospora echinospora]